MTDISQPLNLPCGIVVKNRIAKSAMSDSLGDGTGYPTAAQERLYQRWAEGGAAISIVGEVQTDAGFAEKPGNLVLNAQSDLERFHKLAKTGSQNGGQLWLQLGHAGAMAYPPTSTPKGPSALDLPGLKCAALTEDEIKVLPAQFAQTAQLAREAGFGGVQVHAAHGFLLSQFLSPLFNKRTDEYGGSIDGRMKLLLEVIQAVRQAAGPDFPIAVKLNSSDQLEGGLEEKDALLVVSALDKTSIDLIDISGGTYFPGAKSASDSSGKGPYFLNFAEKARKRTTKPLMATGGFKTLAHATGALSGGAIDVVGLARALVVEPSLPNLWLTGECSEPEFPRFTNPPEGGVTACYTLRLTEIGEDREGAFDTDPDKIIQAYEARDQQRAKIWQQHFGRPTTT
ncbi:NADH:flavin oxidoreductase/NADH oxidase family protein [Labrenzia sp. PHM005]|uniref:NADH:flavin oxidoreductase/NADH oxidase family protein n=1 Tax=Labrenzia sp. PHM005 TaxID=2590016 RepID=UPI0011408EA0|nr:NADH:flavin oxidoreductase/NADH oxidase family protein [Labrenzia sp. PHM005]QDG74682.1 NADH:flavin oxidoreductase/NADH oxidase family protein [Labrenzia sp. PHM005]